MRIPINLASQPFRHNRALLLGSGFLAVIMIGTLVMLISLARTDARHKRDSAKQLEEARVQLNTVRKDLTAVERELRQQHNEAVLERCVLLNDILLRKGISWTRIFSDLEKVIPYNVQVLQIRPQIDKNNHIYLQMVLGADQPAHITACIEKLEASEVFGATRVTTIVPPSQTDPLFRYQVTVIYAQKL
jgi:type IV pilus assembly protein PilN